jgi:hypothetical protein
MQTRDRRFGIWQPCGGVGLLVALSGCAAEDAPATRPGSGGAGVGGQSAAGGATATGGVGASSGATAMGGSGTGGSAGGNLSSGGAPPAGGNGASGQSGGGSLAGGSGGTTQGGAGTMAGAGGGSAAGASGAGAMAGAGGATGGGAAGSGSGGTSAGAGSTVDATIVPDPGWACGMEDGIPPPTKGELAFTITLNISAEHEVGKTPYGQRRLLDVSGGTITGDRLQGTVVTGGLEYELTLDNGVVEYQSINVLETSAGRIFVRSCGVARDKDSGARIIPDFEATTSGANAFLNTGKWVATREVTSGKMKLDVYDVADVTPGEPLVQISKPANVPPQPWECNTTKGTQGSQVFTENVSLGSSYSINNAKYGSRNIIPITGGTTTGKVTGKILNGGADYQLSGSLDAWYTLAPDNGEFILVRNCGASGGLIPWFEATVDGEFNFLNTQAYLSSAPGVGGGGVSITFYDRK